MALPALAAIVPQALSLAKPLLEIAPMAIKGLTKDDGKNPDDSV